MKLVQATAAGFVAALTVTPLAPSADAADLTVNYPAAPVLAAPVAVPLAGGAVMYSPIRSRSFRPIQTHVIAQPAPNPRAIGEGPVFGPAYPVIIVVKP